MNNNKIYITSGNNPLQKTIDLLETMQAEKDIPANAKICIKPNLVFAKEASTGTTTHPEIVEGVIKYLFNYKKKNIKIIESSSIMENTKRAFKICGYEKLKDKYNIQLIDLKSDSNKKISIDGYDIEIAQTVLDCDYLINIPVLKGHSMTYYTGALKNLKGCIPDDEKRKFHRDGLHKPIALLNKIIKTHLVIMDALNGDPDTEFGGNPSNINMILAGKDPVLIDTYACGILKQPVSRVSYIIIAENLGIGSTNLNSAEIIQLNKSNLKDLNLNTKKLSAIVYSKIHENQACSVCYDALIRALYQLNDNITGLKTPIYIGQGFKNQSKDGIGIGDCTGLFKKNVPGCPPDCEEIIKYFKNQLNLF